MSRCFITDAITVSNDIFGKKCAISLRLFKNYQIMSWMYCLFCICISMILCLNNVGCCIPIIDMLTSNACLSFSQKCINRTGLYTNVVQVGDQDSYKTSVNHFFLRKCHFQLNSMTVVF